MNLRDYVMIFFRRKWIFIMLFLISVIWGFLYVIFAPKVYQASSLISIQSEGMLNPLMDKMAVTTKYGERLRTMRARILSWPRIVNMVADLKMNLAIKTPLDFENYVMGLRQKVEISMYEQDLIKISYEDKDPYLSKQVVDYLTNSFINESTEIKNEEAVKAIDFIRSQLDVYRTRLESSEKDLTQLKVKAEIESIDNQKQQVQEQLAKQEKVVISEVKREQNPLIKQLNDHIADLEQQLSKLLIDSTENHPMVKELRREIAKTRDKMAQEEEKSKTINVEEKSSANPIYADLDQQLKRLELRRLSLLQRQEDIKTKTSKYKLAGVSDSELAALDRDAKVNENLYTNLLSTLESARISQQLENVDKGTKFKIIDPARMPVKPYKPDIMKMMLISMVMGLSLGFAGIYTAESMDHSLRNVEDAKAFFKKPLLGAISKIELDEDAAKKVTRMIRG
ncbi:MAG: GNVR domain-containing protein [bacterium]|nr:GNVR domain-containing protein [bacterium]